MKQTTLIGYGIGAIALITGAILGLCSVYSVDAGETAIVTRYGEIVDTKTSGLNWKSPIENVETFSTREAKFEIGTFNSKSGDVTGGLSAYTADRQTATVALTISYQIHNPEEVYTKYKTTDNMLNVLLQPKLRQQLEIVFSRYTSQTVIEKRAEFATQLRQAIIDEFKGYPLAINDVQAVFNFSPEYEKRMEESINQDVAIRNKERETKLKLEEAKQLQIKADADAAVLVTQAKANAEQVKVEADAQAHAIEVKGQAEANSAKALAEALEKNQNLVALKTAEKWNGVLPTYIPQGTVMPFVQLPTK